MCCCLQEALHCLYVRWKIARAFFPATDGAGNYCGGSAGDIARAGRGFGLLGLIVCSLQECLPRLTAGFN